MPERARVLVVDDHALLRTGVANIINQEPDLEVVAEAADGLAAVQAFVSGVWTTRTVSLSTAVAGI